MTIVLKNHKDYSTLWEIGPKAMKSGKAIMRKPIDIVGTHPKKVVALMLTLTLIMSFFASQMLVDVDEEGFNPESAKADAMEDIREKFGTAGESVQIAFVSDQKDIFTVDVFTDIVNTKIAFLDDEYISYVILPSADMPQGITTIVDTYFTGEMILKTEQHLIEFSNLTNSMEQMSYHQREMYEAKNISLSICAGLLQEPTAHTGAKGALEAMATITADPSRWTAFGEHPQEFGELIGVLSSPEISMEEKIAYIDHFIYQMDPQGDTWASYPAHGMEDFLNLLDSTNTILKNVETPELQNSALNMVLSYLGISQHIEYLSSELDLDIETPSLTLSDEEKLQRLEEMVDDDIKDTVRRLRDHDGTELWNALNVTFDNLESVEYHNHHSLQVLGDIEYILETLAGFDDLSEPRTVYKTAVSENVAMLEYSLEEMQNTGLLLSSAYNLPFLINNIYDGITMLASRDFSSGLGQHLIKASSTMGIILMNNSMESELRREAQKNIISISEDVCVNSEPKVFASKIMMQEINESADESLRTLLPIAMIFVVVVLLLVFRTVAETVLSLVSLSFAILWTFGIGVLLGYRFNPILIAVPVLITGLVIDYGIHMVMRYREERYDGSSAEKATMIAMGTVGGALILTTVTTAIGFFSNYFSNIQAMRQFGMLAAVGILASFVLMTVFLPATICIIDKRRNSKGNSISKRNNSNLEKMGSDLIGRMLSRSADASDRHPLLVLLVVAIITFAALYGALNVDTTFNIQDFLPEGKPQSDNINYIADNFRISTSYAYILIEGDADEPEYLQALHRTQEGIKDNVMTRYEDGASSVLTIIIDFGTAPSGSHRYNASIVSAYLESQPDENGIPTTNIGRLYDTLYSATESREAIRRVLYRGDDGYMYSVIMVRENTRRMVEDIGNAAVMERELEEDLVYLEEEGYSIIVTSSSIITFETTEELSATQIRSLFATIIIVALLLTLVFYKVHRSKLLGLITTIPVALITIWIVGTMYLLGVSLNVMTVSITALTVGMGVDYSIHIAHRFLEEKEKGELYDAMHETVQKTGAGLVGSAATTIGAFAIISTSEILPMSQFGMITAIAIAYSFFSAVFVLPSALMVWAKYTQR